MKPVNLQLNESQNAGCNCACKNDHDKVDFPPKAVLTRFITNPEAVRQRCTEPVDDVRFSHKFGNRRLHVAWPVGLASFGLLQNRKPPIDVLRSFAKKLRSFR